MCLHTVSRGEKPGGELKQNKWQLPLKSGCIIMEDCCFHWPNECLLFCVWSKGYQTKFAVEINDQKGWLFLAPWLVSASLEGHQCPLYLGIDLTQWDPKASHYKLNLWCSFLSLSIMSDLCFLGSLVLTHSLSVDYHLIDSLVFLQCESNIDLTFRNYRPYFISLLWIITYKTL